MNELLLWLYYISVILVRGTLHVVYNSSNTLKNYLFTCISHQLSAFLQVVVQGLGFFHLVVPLSSKTLSSFSSCKQKWKNVRENPGYLKLTDQKYTITFIHIPLPKTQSYGPTYLWRWLQNRVHVIPPHQNGFLKKCITRQFLSLVLTYISLIKIILSEKTACFKRLWLLLNSFYKIKMHVFKPYDIEEIFWCNKI